MDGKQRKAKLYDYYAVSGRGYGGVRREIAQIHTDRLMEKFPAQGLNRDFHENSQFGRRVKQAMASFVFLGFLGAAIERRRKSHPIKVERRKLEPFFNSYNIIERLERYYAIGEGEKPIGLKKDLQKLRDRAIEHFWKRFNNSEKPTAGEMNEFLKESVSIHWPKGEDIKANYPRKIVALYKPKK